MALDDGENAMTSAIGRHSLPPVDLPNVVLWAGAPEVEGTEITRDFLVADVFTGSPLEGNQLGIFLDGRGLSDELMRGTAREMNFSETVFFLPPTAPGAAARVRIFTPADELPFAGHPTLGSAWVLGDLLGQDTVTLELGVGLVPVELERDGKAITFGRMTQPIPEIAAYDRVPELLDALGVTPAAGALPFDSYRNGPLNVYVEVDGEDTLAALAPDMQKLARLPVNVSCFTHAPHGITLRMFAPALGVTEDPATGSAAGPLALHLALHGRIAFGEEIEIHQGGQIHRPSVLYARVEGTVDRVERVFVGGRAVIVARGQYRLA
jgi:trans-2,3-dihydro-3-hydroxyanthranilate isomerase